MQAIKRTFCLFCAFCILASFFSLSSAAAKPVLPSMDEAEAVYLIHLESGEVVADKNADIQRFAGSSVKVMSGLLLAEMAKERLGETVTVTKEMLAGVWGHSLSLSAGDAILVEDLLYASVCGSYNDAIYVLSAYFCGSVDAFVTLMNEKASALGLQSTRFTDPVGIDDNSMTTARDVARVAQSAAENALYAEICRVAKFSFPAIQKAGTRTLYNRNSMIASQTTNRYYNSRCVGMSAGSTSKGGQCVIALAKDQGESYLAIVLGAREDDKAEYGYVVANRLIDWVYKTYTYMEVINADTPICTLPVTMSDLVTQVEVRANETLSCYIPAGLTVGEEIQYSIRLFYDELEAPVSAGTHVGYLAIVYEDRILGMVELYTAGEAERNGLMGGLHALKSITQNRAALASILFFAIGLTAWITTESIIRARRRHKWDKYFGNKMGVHPDLYKINQKKD